MAQCITCGAELHPERARKYNYCMARECQEKNAKGLTMMAVGMNKAADELVILDERTREELANGRYQDQRRGSFRPLPRAPRPEGAADAVRAAGRPARPWTASQEKLVLLYNQQGLRPDEIAQKLGISRYMVTQIILGARNRGKA